jgi:hypothetical protein
MQEEDVSRFSGKVPNLTTQGDVESMALYAGAGASRIQEVIPAASVIAGVLEEAQALIEYRLRGLLEIRPKHTASTMV